ncbi:MAG: class I SAM-dependent methyltransferase [Flammeovirgaceae bacterium]
MTRILPSFLTPETLQDGIHVLSDPQVFSAFETTYLNVRDKEKRFYADEVIAQLPYTASQHPYHNEWQLRVPIIESFLNYIKEKHTQGLVLEIGCGNAWLSAQIAKAGVAQAIALDVNRTELMDGVRIFQAIENLHFVYADIFSSPFPAYTFDVIVLAGVVQYFPNFHLLINTLQAFLKPQGEIHLFDSPFYQQKEQQAAKKRTREYYTHLGFPEMANRFHHHTIAVLHEFNTELLYNPKQLKIKLLQKIKPMNPFPWVCIRL